MASQEICGSSAILLQVRKLERLIDFPKASLLARGRVKERNQAHRQQAASSFSLTHCIHTWEKGVAGWQNKQHHTSSGGIKEDIYWD